jgi:WD40 repeat protein
MKGDAARNNLFLVANQASPSVIQPIGVSTTTANTVVLTPGTATPSAAGAGPSAISSSNSLLFTGDSTSVSYYTYTSAGVVGPAISVALPAWYSSYTRAPNSIIVGAADQYLYAGFPAPTARPGVVQPFTIQGGVLQPPNVNDKAFMSTNGGVNKLVLHPSGNFLFCACNDGTITVLTITGGTTLTPKPGSPYTASPPVIAHPSTRGMAISPAGDILVCANDDASDSVVSFSVDAQGGLTQIGTPYTLANALPNWVVFHPSGSVVYVTNGGNNTLSALSVSTTSGPSPLAGSPYALPKGDTGPGVLVFK